MIDQNIDVAVVQITDNCHLDCIYHEKKDNPTDLDIDIFKTLIEQNSKLEKSVKVIELGWFGEPLTHKKFPEILKILSEFNINYNIVTHGDLVKDKIARLNDEIIKNSHFTIFLDGSNGETIKKINGKDIFNQIIESMEYIKARGRNFDVIMRVNKLNYNQLEETYEVAYHYGCNMFIPIEGFPVHRNKKFILTDNMKHEVIKTIEFLSSTGKTLKTIQFENPPGNCTYFRKRRLFIDCKGRLSYCHFLAYLENTGFTDFNESDFQEMLELNEILRDKFTQIKEKSMLDWKFPRETSSPCSYCIQRYGQKVKW